MHHEFLNYCLIKWYTRLENIFNSTVLWTIGNYHVKKYGCGRFAYLLGLSCLAGSALGLYEVRYNARKVISGSMAFSASLITYNVFANPHWFTILRIHPAFWLGGLALYGAYENDKACIGGIAAGYLALLLALWTKYFYLNLFGTKKDKTLIKVTKRRFISKKIILLTFNFLITLGQNNGEF